MLLLQLPGDCLLTGLCGLTQAAGAPPSGLLFVALGSVLAGGIGWSRSRRKGDPG